MFLFALLVVGSFAVYCLKPEERVRGVQAIVRLLRRAFDTIHTHTRQRKADDFGDALAARTRRPFLTAALVVCNLVMFVLMVAAPGSVGDSETLLRWGASVGPVTANGEWWRLVTATFVHAGVIPLIVDLIAFTQVALLVERMFGQVALAVIYVAAAAFSGAICLWSQPLAITSGASGAVFGIYPNVLPALEPENSLAIYNAKAGAYGLSVGLIWWSIGILIALGYFTFLFRTFKGKIAVGEGGH